MADTVENMSEPFEQLLAGPENAPSAAESDVDELVDRLIAELSDDSHATDAPAGQVGLGVDIVEIERIKDILQRTPCFAERVFSEEERAYCESRANPEAHYATRFAAKEAVVKALGTGFAEGVGFRDIEVRRTSKGRPYVVLSGAAKDVAKRLGARELPVSLSYTRSDAVACVMAITQDSVAAAQKRVDPMEELAKQFKEARGLLDTLPANGVDAQL